MAALLALADEQLEQIALLLPCPAICSLLASSRTIGAALARLPAVGLRAREWPVNGEKEAPGTLLLVVLKARIAVRAAVSISARDGGGVTP